MTPEQQTSLNLHMAWINGYPDGVRCALPNQDWTDTDFTTYSFKNIDLRHGNFSNCIMPHDCQNAILSTMSGTNIDFSTNSCDISNSSLCASNVEGCNIIGAIWNGVPITKVSAVLIPNTDLYWTWCTNAFVQIGCTQRTLSEWESIGSSLNSIADFYANNSSVDPQATWDWWNTNAQIIRDWYSQ